jgi:hypothetical protein
MLLVSTRASIIAPNDICLLEVIYNQSKKVWTNIPQEWFDGSQDKFECIR